MIDISDLTIPQLRQLAVQVKETLERREIEEIKKARNNIEDVAKALGVTFDELLQSKAWRSVNRVARYVHPEDGALAWSGIGKQPKWVKDWLAGGKPMEALLNTNLYR